MPLPQEIDFKSGVQIQAMTDVGRYRTHNEDNFIVCPDLSEKRWYLSDEPQRLSAKGCLLVVADGMGGANAGEIASELAVESIRSTFDALAIDENPSEATIQTWLQQAIISAHEAIVAAAAQNTEYAGMGTTLVLAWVLPKKAIIGWVGDSRAYRYAKRGGLQLLTDDHSLVWELVKAGRLTPAEADVHPDSNIITQSLGDSRRPPVPEFTSCALKQGDRLLLCSDGLNNMVTHGTIEKIMGEGTSLAHTCQKLIQTANAEGGADNITVLSLELLGKSSTKKLSGLINRFSNLFYYSFLAGLFAGFTAI